MGKRVVIVDYNHLAHSYFNSKFRLSKTIVENGITRVIDTTVQSGSIKAIHRWSNGGSNPTAVCFDSPVPSRKAYFAKNFGMAVDGDKAYKAGRKFMGNEMLDAITMVQNILASAGVSVFKGNNYEADDLVFACIQRAKQDYPDLPIDVVTNDADLLPLVDDTVSVFLRSKTRTWAEDPSIEKAHYVQVTPDNYQEVVENLSAYRKFSVPYNSILLQKILRGDSSDNIVTAKEISKLFPPKKYNAIIEAMLDDGVDLSNLFRYGANRETLVSIKTGEVVGPDHDKDDLAIRYDDPKELEDMINTLCWYIEDDEVLKFIKKMYRGMNLNQAYSGLGNISRKPAKLKGISNFNEGLLQSKLLPLDIRLRMNY